MRDEDRLELIMNNALSQQQEPDNELNLAIKKQIREKTMKPNRKRKFVPGIALVAIMVLVMSVTVIGAVRFLSARDAAKNMGYDKMAEAFEGENAIEINEVIEAGDYQISLLGVTSDKALANMDNANWEVQPGSSYAVVAIARKDGTPMPNEDDESYVQQSFFISPLIQGLNPEIYNIASMNGGYSENTIDGIMYRIIQCDNIELFADKELYLCVTDGILYNQSAYNYDKTSGIITENNDYEGIHVLFDLPLDKAEADPDKAAVYLEQLEAQWSQASVEDNSAKMTEEEKMLLDEAQQDVKAVDGELKRINAALEDGTAKDYLTKNATLQTDATQILEEIDGSYELKVTDDETMYFYTSDFIDGKNCYIAGEEDRYIYYFLQDNEDGTATMEVYVKEL